MLLSVLFVHVVGHVAVVDGAVVVAVACPGDQGAGVNGKSRRDIPSHPRNMGIQLIIMCGE